MIHHPLSQTPNSIKKFRVLVIAALAFLASCGSHRTVERSSIKLEDLGSTEEVVRRLSLLRSRLEQISATVLINDQARLQVLGQSVTQTSEMIKTRGVGNIKSLNILRKLVMYFIYSEQFLQFIRTEENNFTIDEVLLDTIAVNSSNSIRVSIGYDEDPLGTILADNLDVVKSRLHELILSPELPETVRDGLMPLVARVGYVLGMAQGQGDRPIPYAEGVKLCAELDAIYPLLNKLNGSQQFFARAQDIRGTNEFLKDFLQVNIPRP